MECIVADLEYNVGFNKLVSMVAEEARNIDQCWHLIPEEAVGQRMQARANKMASEHLINILDYIKSDIENTKKVIAELKSDELV